jgi:hypothetical protein
MPHTGWPQAVLPTIQRAITCEYASLTRAGAPITWPITPYYDEGGTTVDVSTGVTYPAKAERARRDPHVALLFSDPTGSGLTDPPTVLVQGLATVRDADLQETTDRYLRRTRSKMPRVLDPWFLMRRQTWYWTRVWIEVTPTRILWWPGGRLDAEPQVWEADPAVAVPPSDPAPQGAAPAGWATPPRDWRTQADRAARLGNPVLTVRDADGRPLPLRSHQVRRVDDGFVVRTGPFDELAKGPACLTFHVHDEPFTGQEHVVLVGEAEPGADGVHVRVERGLADFSLAGGSLARARSFMGSGRRLAPRLAHEVARRGQRVPVIRKPA